MLNETSNVRAHWGIHAQLDETKRGLAKLLARENITVRHEATETAHFDLLTRELVLPLWSNITVDQYDLLIGHEVAHAKYSDDLAGLTASDVTPGLHSYINVLEDTRIERKIKDEFPGLRAAFRRGYAEFFANGPIFHDLGAVTFERYSFIDRVNIHYKVGASVAVPFTAEEREILPRIEALRTMSDAIALARELYAAEQQKAKPSQEPSDADKASKTSKASKAQPSNQPAEAQPSQSSKSESSKSESESESSEASESESSEASESKSESESESSEASESKSESESESSEASESESSESEASNAPASSEPVAKTDVKNQEALKSLADMRDQHGLEITQATLGVLPSSVVDVLTVTNPQYLADIDTFFAKTPAAKVVATKYLAEFRTDQTRVIKALAAEFERKKTAKLMDHARVARTGKIDVNKLHAYKFREDLFKSVMTLPNGKNHGLVLLIDASGSMSSVMADTLCQTLLFADFAKRVNIPLKAFLFGLNYRDQAVTTTITRTLNATVTRSLLPDEQSRLVTVLDTTAPRWNDQMVAVAAMAARFDYNWRNDQYTTQPYGVQSLGYLPHSNLGGTPLVGGLLVAEAHIAALKASRKLDKMTCVILTDGENTNSLTVNQPKLGVVPAVHALHVRDSVTRKTYAYYELSTHWNNTQHYRALDNDQLAVVADAIQSRHDCRILGIRLVEGRAARRRNGVWDADYVLRGFLRPSSRRAAPYVPSAKVTTQFEQTGTASFSGDAFLADGVVLVSASKLNLDADEERAEFDRLDPSKVQTRTIVRAFKDAAKTATANRLFVNAVMPFIA